MRRAAQRCAGQAGRTGSGPSDRTTQRLATEARPFAGRVSGALGYRRTAMPTVPDKPTLDGIDATWAQRWADDGTYHFDRTATPRPGVLGRHPAAHGVGLAPHRPRLQLHPHRHGGPLPPHAGPAGLLPDGLGRQRPADRAAGAELLRRPLRPVTALRPGLPPAGETRQGPGARRPAQLRRAVRAAHRGGRAGLRGRVAPARAVGRLAALLHDDRRALPADQPGGVPAQPGPGRGLPAGGPDPLGRRRPHGRRPGRDGGPGDARRVPPARVPPDRRVGRHRHRHHPPRARRLVRGPGRPPRRRPPPAPLRHHGHDAPVRRGDPRRGPRAGRPGEGHRHRHDLHLRGRHRRHLVARAPAADPGRRRARRPPGRRGARLDHHRRRSRRVRRAGRSDGQAGPGPDRSSCCGSRASCWASPGRSRTP